MGTDGIPCYIFKACSDLFVIPLLHICNFSLKANTFPEIWKIIKIIRWDILYSELIKILHFFSLKRRDFSALLINP